MRHRKSSARQDTRSQGRPLGWGLLRDARSQGELRPRPRRSRRETTASAAVWASGVQFYTGQHLKYSTDRKTIKKYQGMCFETQGFPNAPNNSKFPSTRLDPSQTYKHNIKFEIEEIK